MDNPRHERCSYREIGVELGSQQRKLAHYIWIICHAGRRQPLYSNKLEGRCGSAAWIEGVSRVRSTTAARFIWCKTRERAYSFKDAGLDGLRGQREDYRPKSMQAAGIAARVQGLARLLAAAARRTWQSSRPKAQDGVTVLAETTLSGSMTARMRCG